VPTTLTSVLIFIVLLLPGFAYLVGKERHGTERHMSPFRETVAIAAASVTSELATLVLFALVSLAWPSGTPNVSALVRNASAYFPVHYRLVVGWGLGMLVVASVLAYAATVPGIRKGVRWIPLLRDYPHDWTVSGWWVAFESWAEGREVVLDCVLDDGSCIRGKLGTFNNSADDTPDRELILCSLIFYRPPGEEKTEEYEAGAACIAARKIVAIFVHYPGDAPTSSSEGEASAAAVATPEAQS
jgi:hypothetical protein